MKVKKILGWLKGFAVFSSKESERELINEAEKFAKRNALVVDLMNDEPRVHVCEKCLKAHMLNVCSARGMVRGRKKFGDDAGHEGYYVDNDKLVKLGENI